MRFEQYFDMCGRGCGSRTAGATLFTSSSLPLDTSKFDQATYYWEVVYTNADGANRTVTLVDGNTSTNITTLTLTGSTTTETRLRSSALTLTTPQSYLFQVQTPTVGTNGHVVVMNSAIVVVQSDGFTKTQINIPLVSGDNVGSSNTDVGTPTDTTTSTTYTQTPIGYPIWFCDKTRFAQFTATPWTFEATFRIEAAGQTASVSLFDHTSASQVAASEVTTTGDTNVHNVSVSFADSNMTDQHEYEVKIKTSSGTAACDIYRCSLRIDLTNVSMFETVILLSKQYTGANSYVAVDVRRQYTASNYLYTPQFFFEGTGSTLAGSPTWSLFDLGATDSGNTGSNVTNGTLSSFTGTRTRFRTSALTLTDGDRFCTNITGTGATNAQFCTAWLVVQVYQPRPLSALGIG